MADGTVPSGEMRWFSSQRDPIDAVLSGDPLDEDLLDVAVIVHDVRSTYLSEEPLRRRPALAAFTEAHLQADSDLPAPAGDSAPPASAAGPAGSVGNDGTRRRVGIRSKMLSTATGFVGTLTGKVVLGTVAAAASVGGLQAANVVDVPVLPDNDSAVVHDRPANEKAKGPGTSADAGAEGKETAAENHDAAQAYADAVQDWTDCVAEAASAQGDAETRVTGGFDPRNACGEHPQPGDFGSKDLPSQASDTATEASGEGHPGQGSAPDQRGSKPEDLPAPASGNDSSEGTGTPAEEAPAGGSKPDELPAPASGNGSSEGTGTPGRQRPLVP